MSDGGSIQIEGLDKLLKALEKCDRDVVEAALQGIEAGAMEIIADAVKNIQDNHSWTTGALAQSAHVSRKGDEVTAGFFDKENKSGYALYVEYGRRAGKFPPPDEMTAYAYKKLHMKDWKLAQSIGFLMGRKIAKEGSEPHPFFGPAVKKNQNKIIKAVRDAVRRATK